MASPRRAVCLSVCLFAHAHACRPAATTQLKLTTTTATAARGNETMASQPQPSSRASPHPHLPRGISGPAQITYHHRDGHRSTAGAGEDQRGNSSPSTCLDLPRSPGLGWAVGRVGEAAALPDLALPLSTNERHRPRSAFTWAPRCLGLPCGLASPRFALAVYGPAARD